MPTAATGEVLRGDDGPDVAIGIHPTMLKRVEWLAEKQGVSLEWMLDDMLWFTMENRPYDGPYVGEGWTD